MAKEVSECICPDNMKEIPKEKALDFLVQRNGQLVIAARFNKECPVHGYEEEKDA